MFTYIHQAGNCVCAHFPTGSIKYLSIYLEIVEIERKGIILFFVAALLGGGARPINLANKQQSVWQQKHTNMAGAARCSLWKTIGSCAPLDQIPNKNEAN